MNFFRGSVFIKVVLINTVVSVVLIGIYLLSFLYYNSKIRQETQHYENQILVSMTQRFDYEVNRLTALAAISVSDPSFILATSSKLPSDSFSQYAQEASEKLRIVSNSLPYADNVFLYTKGDQKFIFTNAIVTKSQYDLVYNKGVGLDTFPSDMVLFKFDELTSGFYQLNPSYSVYVTDIYGYGSLIIKIDTAKFSNLQGFNALQPFYQVAVLDDRNRIFAVSSPNVVELLKNIDLQNYNSDEIKFNQETYSLRERLTQTGFRFMLIGQKSTLQNLETQNSLVGIFIPITVFLICVFLILINAILYNPLRKIARKYGSDNKNEIDFISGKVTQLLDENTQMQQQIRLQHGTQADIELNYAIHSKAGITNELAKQLKSQYGQYRIVVLALQGSQGEGEKHLLSVDDAFEGIFHCKMIAIDPYIHAYLISDTKETGDVAEKIGNCLKVTAPDVLTYVGISDFSDNFSHINKNYLQAYERMLGNRIPNTKPYAICISDDQTMKSSPAAVSFEIQSTIARCTMSGDRKDIESVLQHLFFSDQNMSLRSAISVYTQLSSLLLVMLSPGDPDIQYEEMVTSTKKSVYHPKFMYDSLAADYAKLNQHRTQEHNALRYGIIEYMHKHFREPLSLDSISKEFGITPVYLSTWFKKNTGVNLSVYLSNIRMEEAKRVLVEDRHIRITDLAIQVGIPSVTAFIRQFKNYTGTTPDQYRQMAPVQNRKSQSGS